MIAIPRPVIAPGTALACSSLYGAARRTAASKNARNSGPIGCWDSVLSTPTESASSPENWRVTNVIASSWSWAIACRPRPKRGRVEDAEAGTLFRDEIGELPLALQVKLLQVIEEKTFTRVGGNQAITVDVRIVTATNRDLDAMVGERQFREDLFYRLNVFPIRLPPLRERPGDIAPLVAHFMAGRGVPRGKGSA